MVCCIRQKMGIAEARWRTRVMLVKKKGDCLGSWKVFRDFAKARHQRASKTISKGLRNAERFGKKGSCDDDRSAMKPLWLTCWSFGP